MSAERQSHPHDGAESSERRGPRKRKNSGFGTRGEGIRVQGDEPFDPHRFQTFEVTPQFRQRILEAQLPLLEPRESFTELTPQSGPRVRAGANDVTLPEFPENAVDAHDSRRSTARSGELRSEDRQEREPSLVEEVAEPSPAPKRHWLIAAALALIVVGFIGTYFALRGVTVAPVQ